jgi:hypothetical protein
MHPPESEEVEARGCKKRGKIKWWVGGSSKIIPGKVNESSNGKTERHYSTVDELNSLL